MSSNNDPYIALSTMESVPTIPCEQSDKIEDFELETQPSRKNTLTHCYHSKYFYHCILLVSLVTLGLLLNNLPDRSSSDEKFMNTSIPELETMSTANQSSTSWNTSITVPTVIPEPEIFEIPCPDGYIFFNQTASCYKVYQTPQTFEEAEQTCVSENGHLASIHSEQENLVIFGMFRIGMDLVFDDLGAWIGLQYQNDSWGWTDGSSPKYNQFLESHRKIRSFGAVVKKTHAFLKPDSINWLNYEDGKYKKMFICKKQANGVVPYSSTHNQRNCKSGYIWFEHTGQCYKGLDAPMTFDRANTTCRSENATLTSVHSEIENLFIIGLSYRDRSLYFRLRDDSSPIWIGMEKNREKWHDGTPVDFQNWDEPAWNHQPEDTGIDNYTGKWASLYTYGFAVCKKY